MNLFINNLLNLLYSGGITLALLENKEINYVLKLFIIKKNLL